jgi:hypothetical protein
MPVPLIVADPAVSPRKLGGQDIENAIIFRRMHKGNQMHF